MKIPAAPIFLLGFLLASASHADTLNGRVASITDGDTLVVLDASNTQHKIRLAGIDAPERAQPFGNKSKTSLGEMSFGQDAQVEWSKHDRYGRIVGKVLVPLPGCHNTCVPTLDVGLAQLVRGMAWWYRQYANEQSPGDREDYERAEFEAQTRRVGLWGEKNPVPPWEWRHQRRKP